MPPQLLYCKRKWTITLHLPSQFSVLQTAIISLCSHLFFPTWRAFVYFISSCSETVLYLKKDKCGLFITPLFFSSSQTKVSCKPYTGMPWLKDSLVLLCAKIISFWLLESTKASERRENFVLVTPSSLRLCSYPKLGKRMQQVNRSVWVWSSPLLPTNLPT